jgi:hypothetical protein
LPDLTFEVNRRGDISFLSANKKLETVFYAQQKIFIGIKYPRDYTTKNLQKFVCLP